MFLLQAIKIVGVALTVLPQDNTVARQNINYLRKLCANNRHGMESQLFNRNRFLSHMIRTQLRFRVIPLKTQCEKSMGGKELLKFNCS